MNGVTYVKESGNTKIMGSKKVDATYASIGSTCPSTCSLKGDGCYAQFGYVNIQVVKLDAQSEGMSAIAVAKAEAKSIDDSYNGGEVPAGRALRLHVSGDSRTVTGSRIINKAVARWKNRGGGSVWSYTHAWRNVVRSEWSNVSMLASVATVKEAKEARKQGYAPAIVVSDHISDKTYSLGGSDTKWIPCPNQTKPNGKEIGCTNCKLCFDADRLFADGFGIAFAAHGVMQNKIKRSLTIIK